MLDQTTSNSRAWSTLLLIMLAIGMIGWGMPATGWAYQDAPADAAGAPPAGDGAAPVSQSFLSWMIEASGIFGAVLLLLSFLMVAIIMMNVLQVRRENLLPQAFIEAFEAKLQGKDYQGAYETARNDDSFVARVLAAGLSKLNRGYGEAVEGMQEVGEEETMEMEHRLSYLALIGSIAPMIGLMGTVYGMINSFRTIAESATQPKPSELADGISTALFTTLEGLTVAIPAMIAYSLLRNRMNRYVLEVGMVSEGLMSRFSSVGKSSKSATPSA
ncbi:MAG: MotA/TolQ/ExbB proton channel family protein [Planctomycetaceae bacterium]|nr:MotA/TolQ/ExbB proton channel family protein [Planctomycetaceae bacterium]